MAMSLERYLQQAGIDPAHAARIDRIREAAVYLRARAYRAWHRSERDEASSNRLGTAERASHAFELRHTAAFREAGRAS